MKYSFDSQRSRFSREKARCLLMERLRERLWNAAARGTRYIRSMKLAASGNR